MKPHLFVLRALLLVAVGSGCSAPRASAPGDSESGQATYRVSGVNRLKVFADRGSFGLEPAFNYGGTRGFRSDGAALRFDEVDQFATEMDDFAQRILTNTPTKVPGEEGLRDVRLLTAIYQAARTGRTVSVS